MTPETSIFIGLTSSVFILTLLFTPLFRSLFHRLSILDAPDAARRIHKVPVPRVGGMAMVLAMAVTAGLVYYFFPNLLAESQRDLVAKIAPSLVVIFVIGVLDDLIGLLAWQKLLGQIFAALIACAGGVVLAGGWWAWPVTVFWLLSCTNGFNLIDGLDGLAGGAGLIASVALGVAALLRGDMALALIAFTLAGGLAGFLRYNFHPASVFLGDSGSLFLGFVLGIIGLLWSETQPGRMGLLAPALIFSVPLLDIVLAILRRASSGKKIFAPDLGHMHHCLLNRNLGYWGSALVLYLMSAIVAVFGLLLGYAQGLLAEASILGVYAVAVVVTTKMLGFLRPVPEQLTASEKANRDSTGMMDRSLTSVKVRKLQPTICTDKVDLDSAHG